MLVFVEDIVFWVKGALECGDKSVVCELDWGSEVAERDPFVVFERLSNSVSLRVFWT